MAQPTTYQKLMAEVYEETAKSVLVYQQEYENDDAEPYEDEDYSDNELKDKDEFNKFHGNRGKPEHVIKPVPKADPAGKTSYNIDKHIRTYALNIDGRFRESIVLTTAPSCNGQTTFMGSNSANFLFNPSRQYKNIHSIRVTSFEFFNTFYTYSAINPTTSLGRGNTTFTITDLGPNIPIPGFIPVAYPITLEDGNYVIVDPVENPLVPNNILEILQTHIRTLGGGTIFADMDIRINPISNMVFFNSVDRQYRLDFPTTVDNPNKNGIGYNLGFYGNSYSSIPTIAPPPPFFSIAGNAIVAESIFDAVNDTYVYLKINDYNIIKHLNYDQTEFGAFMKIPLTSPKNAIQFMNSTTNTTAREYFFPQPTNISSFLFEMIDAYGKTLQMNGSTFSVTLEIQEVLQSDIYEKMLEL